MVGKREILCPYCCKRFGTNEVHFRLKSPLNDDVEEVAQEDDDAIGTGIGRRRSSERKNSGNNQGKVLDERLYHYYEAIHDEDTARMEAMKYGFVEFNVMDPQIEYNRQDFQRHGYVNAIRYQGQELTTRLCPYCHMDLIQSAGKYDMYMVSVIGDTAVGKSIYLAVLQTMIEKGPFNASMLFMGTKKKRSIICLLRKKLLWSNAELRLQLEESHR